MKLIRRLQRVLAVPLIAVMAWVSVPLGVAQAALVTTDEILAPHSKAQGDRDRVMGLMAREDVRSQFKAWGVDPAEAERRVAALSDSEIANLSARLPDEPAGQGVLAVAVGIAIIAFVVLVVTDLLGYTDVFPFIHKARTNP